MTRFSKTKCAFSAALLVMFAAPQITRAQSSSSLSGLYACETLIDKNLQLSCFLTETAKLRAKNMPATPEAATSVDPTIKTDAIVQAQGLAAEKERLAVEKERLAIEKERAALEKQRVVAMNESDDKKSQKEKEKKTKSPKERTVAIRSATVTPGSGYIRFTLENGEVWRQSAPARIRMGKGSPDVLVIKKASFGSFIGKVNGKSPSFRMKRVK
ncbi:MAG: hypothetical protein ABJO36_10155 [Litorimonas sp.]